MKSKVKKMKNMIILFDIGDSSVKISLENSVKTYECAVTIIVV